MATRTRGIPGKTRLPPKGDPSRRSRVVAVTRSRVKRRGLSDHKHDRAQPTTDLARRRLAHAGPKEGRCTRILGRSGQHRCADIQGITVRFPPERTRRRWAPRRQARGTPGGPLGSAWVSGQSCEGAGTVGVEGYCPRVRRTGCRRRCIAMRAVVYHAYGLPEVLRVEEVEKPVAKDDGLAGPRSCGVGESVGLGSPAR